jgi:hypothetical protein
MGEANWGAQAIRVPGTAAPFGTGPCYQSGPDTDSASLRRQASLPPTFDRPDGPAVVDSGFKHLPTSAGLF